MTDKEIEIIQDHNSYEIAMRMIMEAAETHVLPSEGVLPIFNDSSAQEDVIAVLQLVTGKEYE